MVTQHTNTYESPEMSIEAISAGNLICTSPQPGGNEDVGYEDWTPVAGKAT